MAIRLKLKNFRAKPGYLLSLRGSYYIVFQHQHQKSPAKLGLCRIVNSTKCVELVIFYYKYEKWSYFILGNDYIEMYELCVARGLLLLITWGLCICLTSTRNLIISTLWQNLQHTHFHKKKLFCFKEFSNGCRFVPNSCFRIFPKTFWSLQLITKDPQS